VGLAGPVPGGLEVRLAVGEQQGLLLARWQLAAHKCGPIHGGLPGQVVIGLVGQQHQVVLQAAIGIPHRAGVALAGLQLDGDFGDVQVLGGCCGFGFELVE
jgi:hypothetical protein